MWESRRLLPTSARIERRCSDIRQPVDYGAMERVGRLLSRNSLQADHQIGVSAQHFFLIRVLIVRMSGLFEELDPARPLTPDAYWALLRRFENALSTLSRFTRYPDRSGGSLLPCPSLSRCWHRRPCLRRLRLWCSRLLVWILRLLSVCLCALRL